MTWLGDAQPFMREVTSHLFSPFNLTHFCKGRGENCLPYGLVHRGGEEAFISGMQTLIP